MDGGVEYLKLINLHIQNLISEKKKELDLERKSLKQLFYMGCGFTEFLTQVFIFLDFSDVQNCRLVCSKWKEFVDEFVIQKHPHVSNFYRWTSGSVENVHLFCGGEVRLVCSDSNNIYCAMKDGTIMIFDSQTFIFMKLLQEEECYFWKIQAGRSILVAITEVCVVIWSKQTWKVLAKIKYWSKGEPFLHVENDLIVAPGATKYVCRVLFYDKVNRAVSRVRDLVHRSYWVLGAYLEGGSVLTLSVSACSSVTSRELKLWDILDGKCSHTLVIGGALGGLPVLRFPFAFLPTAAKGLEIWNIAKEEKIRTIATNIFSFQVKNQFLFILNKHSNLKIYKIKDVTGTTVPSNKLWSREIHWPLEGPNVGSIPKFKIENSRALVLTTTGNAQDVLLIIKLNKSSFKQIEKEICSIMLQNATINQTEVDETTQVFDIEKTENVAKAVKHETEDFCIALPCKVMKIIEMEEENNQSQETLNLDNQIQELEESNTFSDNEGIESPIAINFTGDNDFIDTSIKDDKSNTNIDNEEIQDIKTTESYQQESQCYEEYDECTTQTFVLFNGKLFEKLEVSKDVKIDSSSPSILENQMKNGIMVDESFDDDLSLEEKRSNVSEDIHTFDNPICSDEFESIEEILETEITDDMSDEIEILEEIECEQTAEEVENDIHVNEINNSKNEVPDENARNEPEIGEIRDNIVVPGRSDEADLDSNSDIQEISDDSKAKLLKILEWNILWRRSMK